MGKIIKQNIININKQMLTVVDTINALEEQLSKKLIMFDNPTFWNKPDKEDKKDLADLNDSILDQKILLNKYIQELQDNIN
jgi:hypothetical protein